MRVNFDLDTEASSWPGPFQGQATSGEAWVGPKGFLGLLQTRLGLTCPSDQELDRVARLGLRLQQEAGFWSGSASVDNLGAAAFLLSWRDELCLRGWNGQVSTGRLGDLWRVTRDLPPGMAERIGEVLDALAEGGADIACVRLAAPAMHLPKSWRDVLASLERQGTRIERGEEPACDGEDARTDLDRARRSSAPLSGDGSLVLLRPGGPLEAAEEVAAWLASLEDCGDTVVVSPDSLLDAALQRHGLPTSGGPAGPHATVLQSILPLVVAAGWHPMDPQVARDLLTLPRSPVPGKIRWQLAAALQEVPATDSDVWRCRVAEILPELDEDDQARFRLIFSADAPLGGSYPAAALAGRIAMVEKWLRRSTHVTSPQARPEAWELAATHARAAATALAELGGRPMTAAEVDRLLVHASGEGIAPFRPEAGLVFVDRPGAICGPARRIVWWQACQVHAPGSKRLPLTPLERIGLQEHGVDLPDLATEADSRALRERRPLRWATGQLVLVAPATDEQGEDSFPHPIWDEIATLAPDPATLTSLMATRLEGPARSARPQRPIVGPVPEITLGVSPPSPPATLSVAGLRRLLGCSLQFVLHDVGKLRPGRSAEMPTADDARHTGNLAHAVLGQCLLEGATAGEARRLALDILDKDGPRLFAAPFMPGAESERARLRRDIPEAASILSSLLGTFPKPIVEEGLEAIWNGIRIVGKPDLRTKDPPVILDLKWGSTTRREQELRFGAALQLAAYAHLAGASPAVGYFIISRRRMLTTEAGLFPGVDALQGPSAAETWQAFEAGWTRRWADIAGGRITVDGIKLDGTGEPVGSKVRDYPGTIEDGRLLLQAECTYCHLDGLCGKRYGGA